ncbi:OsmC family protein [Cytophagales bacterium LB-30]|uniref:OsmC family protein n=1 Tax=Shiella aurantiaca TaxID=3058365 RepID=A0ABT8F400_9BACT|nr:OsmC family protein [Shiella aurantiaca]MDN4164999.1 OsmC family protein [Shiella aurantiaca]
MSMPYTYQVDLQWKEGRLGQLNSPELNTKIEVATPPEFDKGIAGIWSPEHLFTASIVSCFMTTFLAVAEYSKLEFERFDCQAKGILDKVEGKMQMTEVILMPVLELKDEMDREKANKIMHKAEAACLISNSVKTAVRLELPTLV